MSASASFILPVHNAQGWLVQRTEILLEELAQFTRDFQIVIIDDGSTDETPSIALDLSARFPQVSLIQQPLRYGWEAAARRGLEIANGDFIFVPEDSTTISGRDLHQLWRSRHDPFLVMVTNQLRDATHDGTASQRIYRRDAANQPIKANASFVGTLKTGLKMIRRDGLSQIGAGAPQSRSLLE